MAAAEAGNKCFSVAGSPCVIILTGIGYQSSSNDVNLFPLLVNLRSQVYSMQKTGHYHSPRAHTHTPPLFFSFAGPHPPFGRGENIGNRRETPRQKRQCCSWATPNSHRLGCRVGLRGARLPLHTARDRGLRGRRPCRGPEGAQEGDEGGGGVLRAAVPGAVAGRRGWEATSGSEGRGGPKTFFAGPVHPARSNLLVIFCSFVIFIPIFVYAD